MSAVFVLVLRVIMTASLYAFLVIALLVMWKNINQAAGDKNISQIPYIKLNLEDHSEKTITFNQLEIFLGRDAQNDFQIQDDRASSSHARIFFRNNQWFIEDLQSTNGTSINNEKISSATVLITEDLIKIGSTLIRVHLS